MTFITGFLIFFLPETHGKKLPDVIEDVEGDNSIMDDVVTPPEQTEKENLETDNLTVVTPTPQIHVVDGVPIHAEQNRNGSPLTDNLSSQADELDPETSTTRL